MIQGAESSVERSEIEEIVGGGAGGVVGPLEEEFGVTVGERIRELRLVAAAEWLRHGEHPISEIATEAGFSDQSHLTRLFRKRFGTTPARYRRTAKRG